MSGHSKWATIKRAKEINDAKRGNLFTKLGNNITIAVRAGGADPETNFKLRLAIDRAKTANLPKENIDRAIKRGSGELGAENIEELTYGALLPGQIVSIIQCTSDNKNRTLTAVKSAITKNGAQFVDPSSIAWQFDNKGVIKISSQGNQEDLEIKIIESGADDYEQHPDEIIIYTQPDQLQKVKTQLEASGLKINSAALELIARQKQEVDDSTLEKITKVFSALDEIDDVTDYYTNLK